MTCFLIAAARNEERYIQEWLDYNFELGFDHIYIIDNNDVDKPLIIEDDRVTIFDFKGRDLGGNFGFKYVQIVNEALNYIEEKYDFGACCDIDEFFDFNGLTLKEFIQKEIIDKGYTLAEIPWKIYTDNNIIEYVEGKVQDLYTDICDKFEFKWMHNEGSWGKSIFKMNKGFEMYNTHWPRPETMELFKSNHVSFDVACVKHYRTKCLEDFLKHKVRSNKFGDVHNNFIQMYFFFNEITIDKLNYINQWVKYNNIILTESDKEFITYYYNLLCNDNEYLS